MTIYALSSGPGISGIAVIRVSGLNTKKFVGKYNFFTFTKAKSGYTSKI